MASFEIKALNLANIQARLKRIPVAAQEALKASLKTEVDELVEAQKRAAPVDESSDYPGALRDSIHSYPNPDRAISFNILADAKDADGKFIGSNIEAGHHAADGTHVAAQPSFFPTYRARKKGMKRRINTAARAAIRQTWES